MGYSKAHVVWLFIACDLEDVKNTNWLCQSCWMDHSKRDIVLPQPLNGNDKYDDIDILWNDCYKSTKILMDSMTAIKECLLRAIDPILSDMVDLAKFCIENFNKYMNGVTSEDDFLLVMHEAEPKIRNLYSEACNIPLPPVDCSDYYQLCQNTFADIDNMALYFSAKGLEKWDKPTRNILMKMSMDNFSKNIKRIELEKNKLNS
ncbi:MAG: hypothetical protein HPY61_08540 [Methanotrichaceae archaeon]|nr:hypothetical protein [Methanotrichaceae archaeon]